MVLSVFVQPQLLRGEHICLILVQCWEKTSLYSLCHRHGASGLLTLVQSWASVTLGLPGPWSPSSLASPTSAGICWLIRVHLLLIRSAIHVFFIMWVGGRLCRRWVCNVPSSVMKTWVYHDILSYFGISQVMFKTETSKHILTLAELHVLVLTSFIKLIKLLRNLMKLLPIHIMIWQKLYYKLISDIIVNDCTRNKILKSQYIFKNFILFYI